MLSYSIKYYLVHTLFALFIFGMGFFHFRFTMRTNPSFLIINQTEQKGFVQIDSISMIPGRVRHYNISLKSIGETPTIEINSFYKRKKLYSILEQVSKEDLIPIKYTKKGLLFYKKPIFTEINGERDFFDIFSKYGDIFSIILSLFFMSIGIFLLLGNKQTT